MVSKVNVTQGEDVPGTPDNRPSALFWAISGLLAVWGLAFVLVFIGLALIAAMPELRADAIAAGRISEEYAGYVAAIPAWGMAVAGIEFFSRLIGAVGLLMRRAFAVPLFAVSLVFILISKFRGFILSDAASVMTAPHIALEIFMVVLSAFALWFAWRMKASGVIGANR